jgi:hypothetical protein
MVLYICNKCNKNFSRKQSYEIHINRKIPCIPENNINKIINLEDNTKYLEENITNLEKNTKYLEENIKKLEENNKQYEENNKELTEKNKLYEDNIKQLEDKIIEIEQKNIILESENKTLNNLVSKCLENNKTIKTNNTTTNNNNTTTNNTINNINVNLVPFGMENLDDLTLEEKTNILNSGFLCSVVCTKKINCNPRLPQYHNISFTNLRSNDAKIYDKDKTWRTVDKEDLFETVILRRLDDVNNILENEEIKISPYMDSLVKKGTDEDEVVKNTKIKKRFHRTVYDFDKNKEKKKLK